MTTNASILDPGRHPVSAGAMDIARSAERWAVRLPEPLRPLAAIAHNFRWSWTPDGPETFRDLDAAAWERHGRSPMRQVIEADPRAVARAAADDAYVARVQALATTIAADLDRPTAGVVPQEHPVAFLCAEFGVHDSLPIYSGGLGVLAGDILKASSDLALPVVAVGLLYREGYFHQRLDETGWQHEYWIRTEPELQPAVRVRDDQGQPLTISVPIGDRDVWARIWRVDVGRVPLYLLDAGIEENGQLAQWTTARLYDGDPQVRLAQYALLGRGAVRALQALGITPSSYHMNEGHPALAAYELASREVATGQPFEKALEAVRDRIVFTTHTPVAAGNEAYPADLVRAAMADLPTLVDTTADQLLSLGRVHPGDMAEPVGMTPAALRIARQANGVSRRHGEVARDMWAPLFGTSPAEVPIGHVTNGVHLPTWLGPRLRSLLDRYLADGWMETAHDPDTWAGVDRIPDAELWDVRQRSRADLVAYASQRGVTDRLRRGVTPRAAEVLNDGLDPDTLTLGFARRVATYKRLNLLTHDPDRALRLLGSDRPIQLLIAGKAHPKDDGAKALVQRMFDLRWDARIARRVVFLEDYDMDVARHLVAGCDVWLNVPRPPLEASGTSGMKVAMNGGLNLSVLDGWWAEGYDGVNGWAIDGSVDVDHGRQDHAHAYALYDLIEHEVLPTFWDRDANGIPQRWVERMKGALRTLGPQFTAARMVRDYALGPWRALQD